VRYAAQLLLDRSLYRPGEPSIPLADTLAVTLAADRMTPSISKSGFPRGVRAPFVVGGGLPSAGRQRRLHDPQRLGRRAIHTGHAQPRRQFSQQKRSFVISPERATGSARLRRAKQRTQRERRPCHHPSQQTQRDVHPEGGELAAGLETACTSSAETHRASRCQFRARSWPRPEVAAMRTSPPCKRLPWHGHFSLTRRPRKVPTQKITVPPGQGRAGHCAGLRGTRSVLTPAGGLCRRKAAGVHIRAAGRPAVGRGGALRDVQVASSR